MMTRINNDVFEADTELIEVTSLHRPDPSWRFVDSAGHEHRWYCHGIPADSYSPSESYELPTTERVEDPPAYYDGDEVPQFHRECVICREHIRPGFTADAHKQYIRGLSRYRINGESVGYEEYKARAEAAIGKFNQAKA